MRSRDQRGCFINKSSVNRKVRSIRVTDEVWGRFGTMAAKRGITRADLLEEIVKTNQVILGNEEAIRMLEESLKLKANAGGVIKKKIREVLKILS